MSKRFDAIGMETHSKAATGLKEQRHYEFWGHEVGKLIQDMDNWIALREAFVLQLKVKIIIGIMILLTGLASVEV